MTCEEFRSRLEREGSDFVGQLPEEFLKHHDLCTSCHSFVQEEVFWHRLFNAVPPTALTKSLWPGVLSKIQDQLERRESFSATVFLFGRRLAPVFGLFLVLAAGVTFWHARGVEAQDAVPLPMIAMLEFEDGKFGPLTEEPDAILNSWVGVDKK